MPNNFLPMDRADAFNPQQGGGGGIAGLFSDPNFLSFLAGAGSKLDPEGVGGAIGGATQGWIQQQQMGKALEKQGDTMDRLLEALAGGKLKKAKVDAKGNVSMEGSDLETSQVPTAQQPDPVAALQTQAASDPGAAAQLDLLNRIGQLAKMLGIGGM